MLLRRTPQPTRVKPKESGAKTKRKNKKKEYNNNNNRNDNFSVRSRDCTPLARWTEMPMPMLCERLLRPPLPKPKRRPRWCCVERSSKAYGPKTEHKRRKNQTGNDRYNFFLPCSFFFCFLGRRVLGIGIKKSENSNNAKSLTHTHTQSDSRETKETGDGRIDSQPAIPKVAASFSLHF